LYFTAPDILPGSTDKGEKIESPMKVKPAVLALQYGSDLILRKFIDREILTPQPLLEGKHGEEFILSAVEGNAVPALKKILQSGNRREAEQRDEHNDRPRGNEKFFPSG